MHASMAAGDINVVSGLLWNNNTPRRCVLSTDAQTKPSLTGVVGKGASGSRTGRRTKKIYSLLVQAERRVLGEVHNVGGVGFDIARHHCRNLPIVRVPVGAHQPPNQPSTLGVIGESCAGAVARGAGWHAATCLQRVSRQSGERSGMQASRTLSFFVKVHGGGEPCAVSISNAE
jgi:hypothetical protein